MRGFVAVVALLVGCDPTIRQVGSHTGAPGTFVGTGSTVGGWHCDRESNEGRCIDYVGPGWDGSARDSDCGVTAAAGPCRASDIGGCVVAAGNPLERIDWYYVGTYYSAADGPYLQAVCESSLGLWLTP